MSPRARKFARLRKAFLGNATAVAGATVSLLVLVAAAGASLMPYGPAEADFFNILSPPSWSHWFGTDSFGRDVLTRVLYGARVSLLVSASGVALAAVPVFVGERAGVASRAAPWPP